ncbi:MAG TPA: hypothetical protein VM818_13020 [Vicinamibacterales bacterium]|nr:hypothetical protein [Vicinamibacterales bacterium]
MRSRTDTGRLSDKPGRRSIVVVASILVALSTVRCQGSPTIVGFRFDEDALVLPSAVLSAIGGPFTEAEAQRIRDMSRRELETAFAGLRLRVAEGADGNDGFWRVVVVQTLPNQGRLPNAGVALPLGPLGGTALVGTDIVASEAARYAPPGASRPTIIEGIGRGIGRVAAHEVAHQIVGPGGKHNDADEDSYEYSSPARASQYYGELHWTVWWPDLQRKVGR